MNQMIDWSKRIRVSDADLGFGSQEASLATYDACQYYLYGESNK